MSEKQCLQFSLPPNKHGYWPEEGQSTNSPAFFPSYLPHSTHPSIPLIQVLTNLLSETQTAYFVPYPPKPCPLYSPHTPPKPLPMSAQLCVSRAKCYVIWVGSHISALLCKISNCALCASILCGPPYSATPLCNQSIDGVLLGYYTC